MNLLEKGNPEEEDFPMDEMKDKEAAIQTDKKVILIAVLVFVILILLILLFAMWFKTQKKTTSTEMVSEEITQYVEEKKLNSETEKNEELMEKGLEASKVGSETEKQETNDSKESAIVVQEDDTHKEMDALLNPSKQEDSLDQDMYYEDYSYEKEYIMKELAGWWDNSGSGAIYDLSALRRYRKLSYSLRDTKQFYYYGDVDADGKPNGKGTAMYADDTYYFGDFVHGKREGNGYWMRFYYNSKNEYSMKGKITMHSYSGGWKNDLPDGSGQEHFDIDMSKLVENDQLYQNVIGGFKAGRYHGDMFANTINEHGEVTEWDGEAENGVFKLQDSLPASGDYPVWKSRSDEPRFLRIAKGTNQDCGITELILEVK